MIALAITALACSLFVFSLGLMQACVDPNETPTFTRAADGKTMIPLGMRKLTDKEKRLRFMWFALASLPMVLFALIFLLIG